MSAGDGTYDVDVAVTQVDDGEGNAMFAGGFYVKVDGVEHGWVLALYPSEEAALQAVHTAILSAMRRTFPPDGGDSI
jgi:hypothetical protein